MPEKNRTYRARIEGYTSEGLGVARIDGQAVFVHRALRGEDCDVLILKVLKNAAVIPCFPNGSPISSIPRRSLWTGARLGGLTMLQ